MAKKINYTLINKMTEKYKKDVKFAYDERYFNLWLDSFTIKGLSHDQSEYIMRKFWDEGSVAAFSIIKPTKTYLGSNAETFSDGLIGLAPFSVQNYNMYNYPTTVRLINQRGVPYIPNKLLVNHKDVVLGFALHSRQSIRSIINNYIDRIVDVEMSIKTNIIASKLSIMVSTTPDSKDKMENLINGIINDIPVLFTDGDSIEALKSVNTGIPLMIDKLYDYKTSLENELLTFMGIDNIGQEKSARLAVDEVNSNNDLINGYRHIIQSNLDEFSNEVKEVLGFDISFIPNRVPVESMRDMYDMQGQVNNDSAIDNSGNTDNSDKKEIIL